MEEIIVTSKDQLKEIISTEIKKELREFSVVFNADNSGKEDELINFKQALLLLKISRPTLFKRMRDGSIPYKRIGRRLLFSKNEILGSLSRSTKNNLGKG